MLNLLLVKLNQTHKMDLDKSMEDEKEESVCCSLGTKKGACWTQFDRKAVRISKV